MSKIYYHVLLLTTQLNHLSELTLFVPHNLNVVFLFGPHNLNVLLPLKDLKIMFSDHEGGYVGRSVWPSGCSAGTLCIPSFLGYVR